MCSLLTRKDKLIPRGMATAVYMAVDEAASPHVTGLSHRRAMAAANPFRFKKIQTK